MVAAARFLRSSWLRKAVAWVEAWVVGMESRSIRSAREAWTDMLGGCARCEGCVVGCCGVWVVDWEVGGFGVVRLELWSVVKIVILSVPEAWSMQAETTDNTNKC